MTSKSCKGALHDVYLNFIARQKPLNYYCVWHFRGWTFRGAAVWLFRSVFLWGVSLEWSRCDSSQSCAQLGFQSLQGEIITCMHCIESLISMILYKMSSMGNPCYFGNPEMRRSMPSNSCLQRCCGTWPSSQTFFWLVTRSLPDRVTSQKKVRLRLWSSRPQNCFLKYSSVFPPLSIVLLWKPCLITSFNF